MSKMNESAIARMFEECGALRDGHFVYASGRHGRRYVNKGFVIAYPRKLQRLCRLMANFFADNGIDVIVAPAVGGVALTQWVAHFLSTKDHEVLALYTEKDPENIGEMALLREYDTLVVGKRVGVVEDIVTTGRSFEKSVKAVEKAGGQVIAGAVLWNRGGVELSVPTLSLVNIQIESFAPEDCRQCKDGVPLTGSLGHAADKKK
jgi:orotate phosphoribosyltransferase